METQVCITLVDQQKLHNIHEICNFWELILPWLLLLQADKLLTPEFQPSVEQLIRFLSANRQILMFSATFPVTVKDFKDKYLPKPYIINLMDELTLKGITQYYSFVEERQKVHCLNTLFSKVSINRCCDYLLSSIHLLSEYDGFMFFICSSK